MSAPTTRRRFLGALASPLAAAQFRAAGQTAERHHVLFLVIDDLNDWIGCLHGHPNTITPNFDRFAKRGVLFTRAYCAAPVCNPSRTAVLTGKRPATTGIYDNRQPMRKSPVLGDAITLPQHFMQHGYRVIGGGKVFHSDYPDPRSWHEYYPAQERTKPADPMPPNRPLNGIPKTSQFDWGPVNAKDSDMGDFKVARWAAGELQKKQDRPFFLACGIFRPHLPWYVPPKYFDMHPLSSIVLPKVNEHDLDDVPPIGRQMALLRGDHEKVLKYGQWAKAVQAYLASITFADEQVGYVLDALESGPHARNTTVVLWSDHGWHLGQKLHWRKFALWEEATHNVFMVSSPGMTKPGSVCERTVNLLDIYPTLIETCGLRPRDGLEGVSLAPLLRDAGAPINRPSLTTYLRENHSVRSERWRYIRYHDGSEELYDHTADPLEWTNAASRPEHADLKKELAEWMPKTNAVESVHEPGNGAGDN